MAAERECRLDFLVLGSWYEAMPLGRQHAIYFLDIVVITVSSLVCLTSIAVVTYGSRRRNANGHVLSSELDITIVQFRQLIKT